MRLCIPLLGLLVTACHSGIYVRDGVTDGNRYSVSEEILLNNDPVLQSWVAYNLSKSVCQLELGGDNPARANSYGCELSSRMVLLDTWQEKRLKNSLLEDEYLDTLSTVREAAYLDEYVVHYFGRQDWFVPAEVDESSFQVWRRTHLINHSPYTRRVGVWGY